MSPYQIKYAGYFIALSEDRKKVLGKGHTPVQALEEAKKGDLMIQY